MNSRILELIYLVNKTYNHISQLMTLANFLEDNEETKDEARVCITTINSHYDYHQRGHREYQNPSNHIDNFVNNYITIDNPQIDNTLTNDFIEECQKHYWKERYKPLSIN